MTSNAHDSDAHALDNAPAALEAGSPAHLPSHDAGDAGDGAQRDARDLPLMSMAETMRGAHIMLTGATGFLGKVAASMLLHRHPDIGQLYLLIRPSRGLSGQERFDQGIAPSPALAPLKAIYQDGYEDFLRDKVTVVEGDVSRDGLGISAQDAAMLRPKLDLFINSAGLVDFAPPLDITLNTNTLGPQRVLAFVRTCDHARMIHVSTCYVAGKRAGERGEVSEEEIPYGYYPRAHEMHVPFSPERELEDCHSVIEAIKRQADDQRRRALFTRQAHEQLADANIRTDHPVHFPEAYAKAREAWLRETLREEGRRRAEHWGWTNTYTFCKSLGEQFLWKSSEEQRDVCLFRPAIVESSRSFPEPGWNEGITTSAPLTYILYKGARFVPVPEVETRLDFVPADDVCLALLAVAAIVLNDRHERVYQVGTSHHNPLTLRRNAELCTLSNRKQYAQDSSTPKWQNLLLNLAESVPVDRKRYERYSAPGVSKIAGRVVSLSKTLSDAVPGPAKLLFKATGSVARKVERQSQAVAKFWEIFMPFTYENQYVFRTDRVQALPALFVPEERPALADIGRYEWREYWLDIHMPGLHRHVFPQLDRRMARASRKRTPPTYDDLLELFAASRENFGDRVAMQQLTAQGMRRFTYADLQARALSVARGLKAAGLEPDARVLLMSENCPEWGMTYFGTLYAKGTAVPVDSALSLREVLNLARSCEAFALVTSKAVRERLEIEGLSEAQETLRAADLDGPDAAVGRMKALTFAALFELADKAQPEPEVIDMGAPRPLAKPAAASNSGGARGYGVQRYGDSGASLPAIAARTAAAPLVGPDRLASLIYTSGTTGTPKGVMLSHGNFTSLLASINQVFDVSPRDTFLSVLPMHHTFEFTGGLLMPLSRGATITYMDELSAEALARAFSETRVTAMIGVPALWQLLHRKIVNEVNARGDTARTVFDALVRFNRTLRDRFGVNLGPYLFRPVHASFGGNIRYLISGGASLPAPIMETFQGLGFELLEGYGLTEASPVLTVARPGQNVRVGSVGQPLPGVTVEISQPDAQGVGEVIAKGGNVMQGYLNNPDATEAVLDGDGWLHTGDLGRFDAKGNLYIVGRQKDVIVSANGENVYPDELEDHFQEHPLIEELSIFGLPDDQGSEKVACVIMPNFDNAEPDASQKDVLQTIRKHIDVQNARLSWPQRIKVLRFTDENLPRTATRKIQRAKVLEILQDMLARERSASGGDASMVESWGEWAWLREAIASMVDLNPKEVRWNASLAEDLSYDSLTFVELSGAIQAKTGHKLTTDDLIEATNARAIVQKLKAAGAQGRDDSGAPRPHSAVSLGGAQEGFDHLPASMRPQTARRARRSDESATLAGLSGGSDMAAIPSPLQASIKQALGMAQKSVYGDGFDVRVYGKAHIPHHTHAIVVANHSSHLDMGLVKYALREWAPDLATLAASDYFFDTRAKRTYFGQLTNLIPMDRSGSLEGSMSRASEAVSSGQPLLIFPEGTRSVSGELADFRSGLGYLARNTKTGVLPVYIHGTYKALPKGAIVPRKRRLEVRIGELIPWAFFEERTAGMTGKQAYIEVARLAREAVLALKTGKRFFDVVDGGEDPKVAAEKRRVDEIFAYLDARFDPKLITGANTYYFSLGQDDHHKWTLRAAPDGCTITPGKVVADGVCVVKTDLDLFSKIVFDGYTPSMDEFMTGKIKSNNPALLIHFQKIFTLT